VAIEFNALAEYHHVVHPSLALALARYPQEDGVAMRKLSVVALVVLAVWTADARAVDLKNVRASYGPFGYPRPNYKVLPGDVLQLNFDVTNLNVDPKTGAVEYAVTQELFDPKGKQLIPDKEKTWKKGVVVGLGGSTVPEATYIVVGVDREPGKYKIVVTVEEKSSKLKTTINQELEVLPPDFGFIHVLAPAIGLVGQDYVAELSLVGWQRDAKKFPKLTLTTRIIDDATGKPTNNVPNISNIPADLPASVDLAKEQFVRMASPIFLNRAGTFTVEFEAKDEIGKKTVKMNYKLTVLPPGGK
jgi:hypothetical protein